MAKQVAPVIDASTREQIEALLAAGDLASLLKVQQLLDAKKDVIRDAEKREMQGNIARVQEHAMAFLAAFKAVYPEARYIYLRETEASRNTRGKAGEPYYLSFQSATGMRFQNYEGKERAGGNGEATE